MRAYDGGVRYPILVLALSAACAAEPEAGFPAADAAGSAETAVPVQPAEVAPAPSRAVPAALEPWTVEGVEPCTRVGNVLLAGQPSAEALAALAAQGTTAVLDLRLEDEARGYDEPARAAELGLDYERLGFGGGRPLDDEVLDRARARLGEQRASGAGDLLLHCAAASRVGAVWLAARTLDEGVAWEQALAEARAVGLASPALEERVQLYVLGAGDSALGKLKLALRAELPDVPRIGVDELAARLASGERPLLLDVRAEREYAVSHLPGARRAETLEAAQAMLAGEPRDREVIVYCSIGYRSGHLAEALRGAGWSDVRNLEGSIFEWANTGHPVWRGAEPVREVHPYDAEWGRLLERALWSELE